MNETYSTPIKGLDNMTEREKLNELCKMEPADGTPEMKLHFLNMVLRQEITVLREALNGTEVRLQGAEQANRLTAIGTADLIKRRSDDHRKEIERKDRIIRGMQGKIARQCNELRRLAETGQFKCGIRSVLFDKGPYTSSVGEPDELMTMWEDITMLCLKNGCGQTAMIRAIREAGK